jgi:hypothetical protein
VHHAAGLFGYDISRKHGDAAVERWIADHAPASAASPPPADPAFRRPLMASSVSRISTTVRSSARPSWFARPSASAPTSIRATRCAQPQVVLDAVPAAAATARWRPRSAMPPATASNGRPPHRHLRVGRSDPPAVRAVRARLVQPRHALPAVGARASARPVTRSSPSTSPRMAAAPAIARPCRISPARCSRWRAGSVPQQR